MAVFKASGLMALRGATVILASPTQAQNFLAALFGPPQTPAGQSYRAGPFVLPFFRPSYPMPERRRNASRPAVLKADETTPEMPKEAKPARVTPDADLVASLMADRTLRRGDIVVFPDGPRVFRGDGTFVSHTMGDFEDLRGSRIVGEKHPS